LFFEALGCWCGEQAFDCAAIGDATGVYDLTVDNDARRRHYSVAHDAGKIFHLLEFDSEMLVASDLLDDLNR
jgi:hypothetical protein